jgi:four helix bundle protein
MTRFQALDLSLQVIRNLGQPLRKTRAQDRRLAEQLQAAASSVALNLGEGRRRTGKDRLHHWRVAAGSAEETLTCLRVAEAWGYLGPSDMEKALRLLDRVLAILWRLTN